MDDYSTARHPQRTLILLLIAGILIVVSIIWLLFHRTARPWEASGALVVAIQPLSESDIQLSFGIDDMELVQENGKTRRVSLLTRRVTIGTDVERRLQVLLTNEIPAGTYRGVRFTVRSIESRSPSGEAPAIEIPTEHIVIDSSFTVTKEQATVVIFGIEGGQALHTDERGHTVYLPVIQAETRTGAVVSADKPETVSVSGGTIVSSMTFGMNAAGEMKQNYRAPKDVLLPQPTMPEIAPDIAEDALPRESDSGTTTQASDDPVDASEDEPATTTEEEETRPSEG